MKISKFTLLAFFLFTNFFVISCNQPKNTNTSNVSAKVTDNESSEINQPPKLVTVKINAPDKEPLTVMAELKYGTWGLDPSKDDNFEYLRQSYCLSNAPKSNEQFVVTPDGKFVRICFSINESKRWQDKRPVTPGTFYVANDERSDMGRIALLSIQVAQGNRQIAGHIDSLSSYGNLIIEKSTENFISGKFALSDKNVSINGNFGTNLQ